MTVLYLISAFGKGSGGHFHSLNNIANALDGYKGINIEIASIGNVASPILKKNPKFLGNLEFKWYLFFQLNGEFKKLLKLKKIDVIHCYDGGTALIIMMLPVFWKINIIHTKCGGPNERNYFAQFLQTIILFSQENLNSFKKNPRFNKASIHLIPNRVQLKEPDYSELFQLQIKDPNLFTFLRIARIGKTYKNSILQAIELVRELVLLQHKVNLIIIGVIEDELTFNEIQSYIQLNNLPVVFLTTKEYTSEASRFLYLADAVVGTGRGIMEAMTLGIPVYAPLKNRKLPVFVNNDTFQGLFENNFSQRNEMDFCTDKNILEFSEKLIKNPLFYKECSDFSLTKGLEFFALSTTILEKYNLIYNKIALSKRSFLILKNIVPIIYYLNAFRRAAKRLPS